MNNKEKEILLKKRYNAEKRFRFFGISSIIIALSFLCILLINIFTNGLSAFSRTKILLKIDFNEKKLGINSSSTEKEIKQANFDEVLQEALLSLAPNATELKQAELLDLVSIDATSELKKFYLKIRKVNHFRFLLILMCLNHHVIEFDKILSCNYYKTCV